MPYSISILNPCLPLPPPCDSTPNTELLQKPSSQQVGGSEYSSSVLISWNWERYGPPWLLGIRQAWTSWSDAPPVEGDRDGEGAGAQGGGGKAGRAGPVQTAEEMDEGIILQSETPRWESLRKAGPSSAWRCTRRGDRHKLPPEKSC